MWNLSCQDEIDDYFFDTACACAAQTGSEHGVRVQDRISFSAGDQQQEEMEDFTDGLGLDGPRGGAASLCAPQYVSPAVQVSLPALHVSSMTRRGSSTLKDRLLSRCCDGSRDLNLRRPAPSSLLSAPMLVVVDEELESVCGRLSFFCTPPLLVIELIIT